MIGYSKSSEIDWEAVANTVGTKTANQCSNKFKNSDYLIAKIRVPKEEVKPSIIPWTEKED